MRGRREAAPRASGRYYRRRVRRVTLALAAVCAAACATSASGASTGVVPPETYVRRADAICLDVARKALALQREAQRRVAGADSNTEARRILASVYRRQLALVRGMRLRLTAIGTPRGAVAARVASRLVADIRAGERALQAVIVATESGTLAAFQRAVTRYRSVSLASARAVRDSPLGFEHCGAGA
jgi:hypothetical protein